LVEWNKLEYHRAGNDTVDSLSTSLEFASMSKI